MMNGDMPATTNKGTLKKVIRKMAPEVREEFLRDAKRDERSAHIRKTDEGKYKVDLYLSSERDGKYESANADKEFSSFEEADSFMEKFFNDNPHESNYNELEE